MLQAASKYVRTFQSGLGVCAVSEEYAEESWREIAVLSKLPYIAGLPNAVPDVRLCVCLITLCLSF